MPPEEGFSSDCITWPVTGLSHNPPNASQFSHRIIPVADGLSSHLRAVSFLPTSHLGLHPLHIPPSHITKSNSHRCTAAPQVPNVHLQTPSCEATTSVAGQTIPPCPTRDSCYSCTDSLNFNPSTNHQAHIAATPLCPGSCSPCFPALTASFE